MALSSSSALGVCSYRDSDVFCLSSSSGYVTVFTKLCARKKCNQQHQQSAIAAKCAGATDNFRLFPSDCVLNHVQNQVQAKIH